MLTMQKSAMCYNDIVMTTFIKKAARVLTNTGHEETARDEELTR